MDRIPLVLASIYDYTWADVEPWVISLKQSGYNGKVALIVYRGKQEFIDKLNQHGIHVICFMKTKDGCDCAFDLNNKGIMSIRFLHMWHFLTADEFFRDVTHVITTDVKDVIFQRDPSELLDGDQIIVSYEGFTYDVEPWSKNNMKQAYGNEIFDIMKDEKIVCAGAFAGGRNNMANLFNQIFILTEGSHYPDRVPGGGGPDQAALNMALVAPEWRAKVKSDERILHAGTSFAAMIEGKGGIGESIYDPRGNPHQVFNYYKEKHLLNSTPWRDDRIIKEVDNKLEYVIIHQYDRIKLWKEALQGKYKE